MKVTLQLEVPPSLAGILPEDAREIGEPERYALAMAWYHSGKLSPEKVAEFLSIPVCTAENLVNEWTMRGLFVQQAHNSALTAVDQSTPPLVYVDDRAKWLSHFDEWMSRQQSRNPDFDDSRESIYGDR